MKNNEGYPDPTASKAIHEADKLPKHIMDVVHTLKLVAGMVGLRITKLELEDRKSGRQYMWRRGDRWTRRLWKSINRKKEN